MQRRMRMERPASPSSCQSTMPTSSLGESLPQLGQCIKTRCPTSLLAGVNTGSLAVVGSFLSSTTTVGTSCDHRSRRVPGSRRPELLNVRLLFFFLCTGTASSDEEPQSEQHGLDPILSAQSGQTQCCQSPQHVA